MKKMLIISLTCAIITFAISYVIEYRYLLSKQPIFKDGKIVGPEDVTSYPPSAAWLKALPMSIIVLVVVFIVAYLIYKIKK